MPDTRHRGRAASVNMRLQKLLGNYGLTRPGAGLVCEGSVSANSEVEICVLQQVDPALRAELQYDAVRGRRPSPPQPPPRAPAADRPRAGADASMGRR